MPLVFFLTDIEWFFSYQEKNEEMSKLGSNMGCSIKRKNKLVNQLLLAETVKDSFSFSIF